MTNSTLKSVSHRSCLCGDAGVQRGICHKRMYAAHQWGHFHFLLNSQQKAENFHSHSDTSILTWLCEILGIPNPPTSPLALMPGMSPSLTSSSARKISSPHSKLITAASSQPGAVHLHLQLCLFSSYPLFPLFHLLAERFPSLPLIPLPTAS